MHEHHHIIVVGAGLSGLYTAWQLQQQKQDVIVLEARQRCGGRILSQSHNNSRYDMGPAWVWPQLQPRLQQLLTKLQLDIFKQYTRGDMLYEKSAADVERYNAQSSHQQSYRISNGGQHLIDTLLTNISSDSVHMNTQVKSIEQSTLHIDTLRNGKHYQYTAEKIILALPPRLLIKNISFNPEFTPEVIDTLNNIPTWMAGHCKILFIYEKPFWREQGLSGEAFSHHGPLSEIYDGSPQNESFFALSAFVGLNAHQRKAITEDELISACMAQLQRLFGEQSQHTIDIKIKDWSRDPLTTTELDLNSPVQHPHYASDQPRHFWNRHLILAGTEVAREHAGYLEGALESADEAIKHALKSFSARVNRTDF